MIKNNHPYPSPNFDARPEGIAPDMLVFHYTDMISTKEALDRLSNPSSNVSAHYLIDEQGTTYALVDPNMRAWHAGVSGWRGRTGINAYSIGIELSNPGHSCGYRPFPDKQIAALVMLSKDLIKQYNILPRMVVGHSDIAPTRKKDPGELFPWMLLGNNGIGLCPEASHINMAPEIAEEALRSIGYMFEDEDLEEVVYAFQC